MKLKKHICFVGASTVEGLGDAQGLGWVGRLAAAYRGTPQEFVPFNLGVRGNTLSMMLARAESECKARIFDPSRAAIVLSASVNDMAYLNGQGPRTPRRSMLRHFDHLLEGLSNLAPLVVIGPSPILEHRLPMAFYGYNFDFKNKDIQAAQQDFAQACAARDIPFLPHFDTMIDNARYKASLEAEDGVHPNDDGYQLIAEEVMAWPAWQELLRA